MVGELPLEDVLGKHRHGVVDEPDIAITTGIVGQLLARQARNECGPEIKVLRIVESHSGEDRATPVEDLDGDGIGLW
jgi:hypothetical protein